MRFSTILLPVLATAVAAQDLSSIISEASAAIGDNTALQSLLAGAASTLQSLESLAQTNTAYGSMYSSLLGVYESQLDAATSKYGTDLASVTGTAASSLAATASKAATGASSTATGNGVDRAVLPALGVVGAAVLGLAAYL